MNLHTFLRASRTLLVIALLANSFVTLSPKSLVQPPRMNDETPAQLVAHLEHPNGWWRDTAQKLLVLRQDKSVVPALQTLARSSRNPLARIHALWTLEGLDAITPPAAARKIKR